MKPVHHNIIWGLTFLVVVSHVETLSGLMLVASHILMLCIGTGIKRTIDLSSETPAQPPEGS